eukprot:9459568-Pyramimonas_sp.AAC.1
MLLVPGHLAQAGGEDGPQVRVPEVHKVPRRALLRLPLFTTFGHHGHLRQQDGQVGAVDGVLQQPPLAHQPH